MSSLWFPDSDSTEGAERIVDRNFLDFDQQASLYDRHDIESRQLTPGPFQGRILTVALDKLTLYAEDKSQSVEQCTTSPPDRYNFRVLLHSPGPYTSFGTVQSMDMVDVHPPASEVSAINPPGCVQMRISVDAQTLINDKVLDQEVADWLSDLGPRGAFITSSTLASQLRFLKDDLLETVSACESQGKLDFLARLLMLQLSSSLNLAFLNNAESRSVSRKAYDRYENVRRVLQDLIDEGRQAEDDALIRDEFKAFGSKRSIELAFKASVGMGPMQYWRLMRLHDVRRKLLQPERRHQSIGDIAAEEGFLDQSKFALYYSRLFGERASDTRNRLVPDEPPASAPYASYGWSDPSSSTGPTNGDLVLDGH